MNGREKRRFVGFSFIIVGIVRFFSGNSGGGGSYLV